MNTQHIPPWERTTQATLTQTLYGAGAIQLNTPCTLLVSEEAAEDGEPHAVTIADGNYQRQVKEIVIPADKLATTVPFRVTGTFVGFTSLLFNGLGSSAVLEWDGGGWHMIGGNAEAERL